MITKKETNLLIKEAQAKLTLTDDAIEIKVSQREGFFNAIQSVQVKATWPAFSRIVELIENGNQILPEKCKHNSSTGVYNKGYIIGAYQLPSGTIIVPDDILEKLKQNTPTVTTAD